MLYQVKTVNGQKTKIPLSDPAPTGNPIGTIISTYKKIQPKNYLYCDGSFFDEDQYPALYLYLGSNQLPDYRECAMVGAEQNTTDTIADHDVYTQGQFKDDQMQDHRHSIYSADNNTGNYRALASSTSLYENAVNQYEIGRTGEPMTGARTGTTTHSKQKAVYYYIKAVDGVDISDEDTFLNTVKDYVDDHSKAITYTHLGGININISTTTGFRSLTVTTDIDYDEDYAYFITTDTIEDIGIVDIRANSIAAGKLCLVFTAPVQLSLSAGRTFYIMKVKLQ